MSSTQDFQREVVDSLARLETKMESAQACIKSHDAKLEELARFQHRLGGILSAVSIAASAAVSLVVAFVKDRYSKQG